MFSSFFLLLTSALRKHACPLILCVLYKTTFSATLGDFLEFLIWNFFYFQIKELNLDNCRSANIVGLDDSFVNLEMLSMINIGLTSLKGFPKLPNLRRLELSDNRISTGLNYLQGSSNLEYLNLCGNRLKDLESLEPLVSSCIYVIQGSKVIFFNRKNYKI